MMDLSILVTPDGHLDESKVVRTEEINKQKNIDRLSLTRFWIDTEQGSRSFIFKPSKDSKPIRFELWLQSEVLPRLENVHSPKLLASRIDEVSNVFWMIFEDMGQIEPVFNYEVRIKAASKMASWHSLPLDTIQKQQQSFMPLIDETMQELCNEWATYAELLQDAGITAERTDLFFRKMMELNGSFPDEQVVCHGDYHCLNLLDRGDDLIVLDWEFIQINSIYWDFYTLFDMATPRYVIRINKETRLDALKEYIDQRALMGWKAPPDFVYHYHMYGLVYSAWILRLLDNDLKAERFDRDALLRQRREMTEIIGDCFDVIVPVG
ncbi:phosphotransferase family enzyme [Paenibacillus taihuensis]|uniref:Phosphotransferase family enzyme n=1 Tax=Paenibacillus taihuensis TaxID=1156355 RepID=A0A3D9RJW3_9BACL|nr:phosphotransferase [Paenibacillus taihuensis]REE80139.1 phosphotransferase family enzyme [Paenibacillus taihuensis]